MRLKYIAIMLLLTGCEKHHILSISSTSSYSVAFLGQSNIVAGNGLSSAYIQTSKNAVMPIECAVGGTYLDEWQKGQPLYNECLAQMRIHPPKYIIWWQGEADAHDMALTLTWGSRFTTLINDLRSDLGYQIPITYVQLGDGPGVEMQGDKWQEMRRQQANVQLSNSKMLDVTFADKYHKINADGNIDVHYVLEGYKVIGERLALLTEE